MKIEFQKLTIQNFKGVLGERIIEFNGTLTQIMGANHTGKTTTADAVLWLLFGKNSDDSSVFGISPKDENGDIIPNLENRVLLEMTADGRAMSLEKVRKEVRTKVKNGDEEKLSYPCTYFIDGNKYTEKDFKAEIDSLCRESLFKSITNPAYFPSLKADQQRALLTKMVGETPMEEIAAQREDFKKLIQQMAVTDLQRFREHLAYRIKELKKELEQIPSRLSEQENELQPLKEQRIDFAQVETEIKDCEAELRKCDDELLDNTKAIDSDYEKRSKERNEINKLKTRQQQIQQSYQDRNMATQRQKQRAVNEAQAKVDEAQARVAQVERSINMATRELQYLEVESQNFRKKWNEVEADEFQWDATRETCPTCGQRLPQGDIDKMRDEAEERFNAAKAAKQDMLDEEAARLKKRKADAEAIKRNNEQRKAAADKELRETQEYLDGEMATGADEFFFMEDEEYQRLAEEIKQRTEALENQSSDTTVNAEAAGREIKQRKAEWNGKRDQLRDKLAIRATIETKEKRIAQLEEKQRTLNQQLSELEGQDYTAEQLTQAIITDLETRVNQLFTNVQFRMFKKLLNGNLEPICECTMHGTPYQDLSNSEKINAGIDIINAICRYNDIYAPMFVDNAESINDVTPTQSQQILLIVSRDKQLTVIR